MKQIKIAVLALFVCSVAVFSVFTIRDFLETKLPDNWDDMDLFARRNWLSGEGVRSEGKKERTGVCTLEIWCECFGKDRAGMNRSDSATIISALIKLGWVKLSKKRKVKLYGAQFVYERGKDV